MFKALTLYRIKSFQPHPNLGSLAFTPCSPSQERSVGWVQPRGQAHGAMIEVIGGHHICKLMIETKAVPASVLNRKVEEMAATIEQSEGRKPGTKERKEIRENALLDLLPMAFPRQAAVLVWIDPSSGLLMVGTTSAAQCDLVLTAMMETMPGISISPVQAVHSPSSCMADWLVSGGDDLYCFSIDRECELKSTDENKATVRYDKHALDIDEVRQHIEGGKVPTKLAMTWEGRVSFLLTETMQVKKLTFLEGVFENISGEKEDKFDTDVAISTGELGKLIPALFEALGGEVEGGAA